MPGASSQVVVSYPKASVPSATPLPGGGSQVVISYPKGDGSDATTEVSVPVPPVEEIVQAANQAAKPSWRPSADQLIAGAAVLVGGTIVALSVVAHKRRKQLPAPGRA